MSAPYAVAGTLMKVSVLVSVATMVKQIAHQGTLRPVRKESRVVFWKRAKYEPNAVMASK